MNPRLTLLAALLAACAAPALAIEAEGPSAVRTYGGMCEASAAVPMRGAPGTFIVANDEDNVLRVYDLASGAEDQGKQLKLDAALGLNPKDEDQKADLEGAAWLGEQLYIIGSHSRSGSKGIERPSRWQILKLKSTGGAGGLELEQALPGGLAKTLSASDPGLAAAMRLGEREIADLTSEAKGLNIEGLAATPAGGLMIGLRNPRASSGEALVVEVKDPATGTLGRVGRIDLKGRGVRSLEYDPTRKLYFVMAGESGKGGNFDLFTWSGDLTDPRVTPVSGFAKILAGLSDFAPEAMYLSPDGRQLHFFSDDGDLKHCQRPKPDKSAKGDKSDTSKADSFDPKFKGVTISLR